MAHANNPLLTAFLSYCSGPKGLSDKTCKAYEYDLNRYISYLNEIELKKATTNDIETYLSELKAQGLSNVTRARVRSSISSFYKFLLKKKYIYSDPASLLDIIKIPRTEPNCLNEYEFERIIEAAKSSTPCYQERDSIILQLFIHCGLRRSELARLNIEDVSLERSELKITRKGGHKQYVPMPESLIKPIRHYLNNRNDTSRALFISKRGTRLSPEAIWRMVKKYSKKAKLDSSVTVHSLRHTYATNLLRKKANLAQIQLLMGHSDIKITARYLHVNSEEIRQVVNSLT